MAGLYPEDQTISLFGKEVRWPRLDISTGKFTNGSFSDPLVEPSFVPAETINLILDNLENLISGMGQTPNNSDPNQLFKAIKDFHFPVGTMLSIYPDEPTPVERGWAGEWEIWSDRAVMYGVSADPPPSFTDYYTLAGNSIPAGNTPVVCYHKTGDDFRLYQFIAQTAAYTVPAELDPVKWTYLAPDAIDERKKCGNLFTEEDYEIGDTVTTGVHTGMYISEIIVPGGKFFGVEGGFRPTFVSGGRQEGRIINFPGEVSHLVTYGLIGNNAKLTGPFKLGTQYSWIQQNNVNSTSYAIGFDPSLAVPTGPDNAGTNLSKRLWRRVS
jgi:hypothetical protein